VRGIVAINLEFIAVEFIEAITGTKPHEARVVLHDSKNGRLRKAFLFGQILERDGLRFRPGEDQATTTK
jgi:hypothetical protein